MWLTAVQLATVDREADAARNEVGQEGQDRRRMRRMEQKS
jgi:hypothetical protein